MTFRSRPLLDLARGQSCTVMSSVCNGNPETTVTAHNPFGDRGTGIKCPDWDSCWACSSCHDLIDGRAYAPGVTPMFRAELFEQARRRTNALMWERGLIDVAGNVPRGTSPKRQQASKILKHPGHITR